MPTTPFKKLSIPATGSEVGVWGSNDLNPNFGVLDNLFGAVTTLNLASGSNVTLTDTQQQAAIIRLTGALPNNVTITFSEPGFWLFDNQTTGNFYVTHVIAGGQQIATPQGTRWQVANDGTNFFFLNHPEPGTYRKFHQLNPVWMNGCTVVPWLPCTAGTYAVATFPALFAVIGTTYGGGGGNFVVPDLRGRIDYDVDSAGRITSVVGGTVGSAGGDQFLQSHAHTWNPTTQGWNCNLSGVPYNCNTSGVVWEGAGTPVFYAPGAGGPPSLGTDSVNVTPNGSISANGSGGSQNLPPLLVTGYTYIKT
jgi:microcystin-dependent protein